jgi:hypothetical protein
MQIDVKNIENVFYDVRKTKQKKTLKRHKFERAPFNSSLLENKLNKFQFVNIIQKDDL